MYKGVGGRGVMWLVGEWEGGNVAGGGVWAARGGVTPVRTV